MIAPSVCFKNLLLWLLGTSLFLFVTNGCNPSIVKDADSGDYDGVLSKLGEEQDSVDVQQALCFAARKGNLKIVQMLVEKGARVNFYLRQLPQEQWPVYWDAPLFEPALYYAIDKKHLEIVKYLVAMGAPVGMDTVLHPLMAAVWAGSTEVASYLISKGADVNAFDAKTDDQRPLYRAVALGDPAMVRLLKSKGAVIPKGKAVLIAGRKRVAYGRELRNTTIASVDGNYSPRTVAEVSPGIHSLMIEGSGFRIKGEGVTITVECKDGDLVGFQPTTSGDGWNVVVTRY